jgi:hypothetical protein
MTTLRHRIGPAPAKAVGLLVGIGGFTVSLSDGRQLSVPYECFPRLDDASSEQRNHFEVCASGRMLHWPEIDEDIEVQHLIDGRMPVKARKAIAAVAEPRPIYGKRGKLGK